MKKFLLFFLLPFVLTGCLGPTVTIGEFVLLESDGKGRAYVYAPSPTFNEIRYKNFSFDWDSKDGFRIYPASNSPERAMWVSVFADAEKMHTFFTYAGRDRHSLTRTDRKALTDFVRARSNPGPHSKHRLDKLEITPCSYLGQAALMIHRESYEEKRDLYMQESGYIFPCPEEPEKYLYSVIWSERGKKEDFQDPRFARQGRRFLESFRLNISAPKSK